MSATRHLDRYRKSLMADCAYQGPPGPTWLKKMAPRYEAWNDALAAVEPVVADLVAACETLVTLAESHFTDPIQTAALDRARAALSRARAEGRAS